jgi:4-amino-4-deoxychorismate lyase
LPGLHPPRVGVGAGGVSKDRYWIDGWPATLLDPAVRAVHYGDGLFETICVRDGVAEYLDRHQQRLQAGCETLRLAFADWAGLDSELRQRAGEMGAGVIKIILSRGAGGQGYRFAADQGVTRIVSTYSLPTYSEEHSTRGVRVRICDLRLGLQPRLAGIKHLNRLEQIMARAEWEQQYEEGLLLDYNEQLIEGTMSNLFLVREGVVYTPPLDNCGVAGIMRSVLLDLAAELGVRANRQVLKLADLGSAQEVFLCNSLIGIWPVVSVADRFEFTVGPLTQALQRAHSEQSKTSAGNWYSW